MRSGSIRLGAAASCTCATSTSACTSSTGTGSRLPGSLWATKCEHKPHG
ncbi:MAG: hypothetical protein JWR87_385 [Segetibacter sp.]|jgi:hypothetical protein|nr:hypothetical protein [Segetibacter sp.]